MKVWENALPPLLGAADSWKLIGGRAGERREEPSDLWDPQVLRGPG